MESIAFNTHTTQSLHWPFDVVFYGRGFSTNYNVMPVKGRPLNYTQKNSLHHNIQLFFVDELTCRDWKSWVVQRDPPTFFCRELYQYTHPVLHTHTHTHTVNGCIIPPANTRSIQHTVYIYISLVSTHLCRTPSSWCAVWSRLHWRWNSELGRLELWWASDGPDPKD